MNPEIKAEKRVTALRKRKVELAKYRINFIFVCIFFLFVLTAGIMFFTVKKDNNSNLDELEKNSANTEFPTLTVENSLDGTFTQNVSNYYTANFPFRDKLIYLMNDVKDLKGIKYDNITIFGDDNTIYNTDTENVFDINQKLENTFNIKSISLKGEIDEMNMESTYAIIDAAINQREEELLSENTEMSEDVTSDENAENKEDSSEIKGEINQNKDTEVTGQKLGALFIIGDTALEIFGGNEKISKEYAAALNEYSELFGPEVTMFNLITPNHAEFGIPEKQKGTVSSPQRKYINFVKDNLNDDIIFVDVYNALNTYYQKGEYLFFRTDHHWTAMGAYRAYEVFCEYAGIEPYGLENYQKKTKPDFLGTLYANCLKKELKNNPDTVEYFVTSLPHSQINVNIASNGSLYETKGNVISENSKHYLVFLGGDIPLSKITTENKNGQKILVFKESYGNAFVPFLVPHYEEIYVGDIRTFPYDAVSFVKENGINQVLFINGIMTSNTSARVNNIKNLKG